MHRPLPVNPRLTRTKRRPPEKVLLACPRISPEWELGALAALIKPQLKGAILHQAAEQKLPPDASQRVRRMVDAVTEKIGYLPVVHWPPAGDYLFAVEVTPNELPEAKGLALVLSIGLPGVWLVFGRIFLRDGKFFRRERGFKLNLVPAPNVHLSRPIRAALSGVL